MATPKNPRKKPATRSRKRATNSRRAEPRELELFADTFCPELKLENGEPLVLYPEQRLMLREFFGGTRESLILIPKKNGKTTLLAALSLYHLTTEQDAACYIAAASRDQATILYDQAKGFVRRSEWLQTYVDVKAGYRQIRSRTDGGMIRVLAADADTADGVLPSLALVDELHRHKTGELYGVFRDGLGPRNGRMITISTAGDDEHSPLGQLRKSAYSLPGVIREGTHRSVTSPGFAMHEWALEPDENRDDMARVKRANPAPWQTEEALAERYASPSMKSWQWARFACGVWLAGEQGVVAEKEWRACEEAGCEIPDGTAGPIVAMDLGWKWDTTAIIPMLCDGEQVTIDHELAILTPPRDGSALDDDEIKDVLWGYDERWTDIVAVLDPEAGGEQLAQWIESELGWTVVTHSQKPSPMALAAQRFTDTISLGNLTQPGHPEFTRQVLAAAAKPVGEGFRFVKPKKKGANVDGPVAAAMGVSVGLSGATSSVYDERGLLTIT